MKLKGEMMKTTCEAKIDARKFTIYGLLSDPGSFFVIPVCNDRQNAQRQSKPRHRNFWWLTFFIYLACCVVPCLGCVKDNEGNKSDTKRGVLDVVTQFAGAQCHEHHLRNRRAGNRATHRQSEETDSRFAEPLKIPKHTNRHHDA